MKRLALYSGRFQVGVDVPRIGAHCFDDNTCVHNISARDLINQLNMFAIAVSFWKFRRGIEDAWS